MIALAVLASAAGLAAVGSVLAVPLGRRLGLLAEPGGRRRHTGPVPRLGGLGVFLGFFGVALALAVFAPLKDEHRLPILGVLIGTLFVFVFGLADDRWEFSAGPQFAAQIAAAVIANAATVFIEQVTLPVFGLVDFRPWRWLITYPLTTLWIMGMMNSINFLDGLDGLAAGVGAIAAILFAIHSQALGQPEIALYSLALAGACLGFLPFNFFPARVFLGSAGALTLGFALSTLSILAPARVMTALFVLVIPIADTVFLILERWRRGQSPFQGDRRHLHFRLMDLGLTQRQIVVGYWLVCALFGGAVLLIDSREGKTITLAVMGVLILLGLFRLSRAPAITESESSGPDPRKS